MAARRKAGVMERSENLDKVRARLQAYFQDSQFYDAQQLCQTLATRLMTSEKYDEAIELLHSTTNKLLEHKQGNAAGELANLLLECYGKAKTPLSPMLIEQILKVFHGFPADAKNARIEFMKQATTWSGTVGKNAAGEPTFHHHLARFLSEQEDYGASQKHWLHSHHPREFAQILLEWSKKGLLGERDLYIARAVLQYLCLEDIDGANACFETYMDIQRSTSGASSAAAAVPSPQSSDAEAKDSSDPLRSPLVNFIRFLLKTVERDAGPLFTMLRNRYATALSRDASFAAYLDRIGELYFGLQAPKGMLEELLSAFK